MVFRRADSSLGRAVGASAEVPLAVGAGDFSAGAGQQGRLRRLRRPGRTKLWSRGKGWKRSVGVSRL